jgi:hypothetical protein
MVIPPSCPPDATEFFFRGNPPFHPASQIVSHYCFSDSVESIEQPWDAPRLQGPIVRLPRFTLVEKVAEGNYFDAERHE